MRKPRFYLIFSSEWSEARALPGRICRGAHPSGSTAQGGPRRSGAERSFSGGTAELERSKL